MEDKELLIKAIDDYVLLSPTYRRILKVFVQIAVDNAVVISIKKLVEITKASKPTLYLALSVLEKEHFIKKISVKGSKIGYFNINPKKLQEVISHYYAKKDIVF